MQNAHVAQPIRDVLNGFFKPVEMFHGLRPEVRYLIQWDNASKRYPVRVVTTYGICLGYFRHDRDAIQFCKEN